MMIYPVLPFLDTRMSVHLKSFLKIAYNVCDRCYILRQLTNEVEFWKPAFAELLLGAQVVVSNKRSDTSRTYIKGHT